MEAEDKSKGEEGTPEEDKLMEDGENMVELGMSPDMLDTMGMYELSQSQGMLWQVHRKKQLMWEEVQSTKAPMESKKMVHSSLKWDPSANVSLANRRGAMMW
ncbi:hypothetical protein NL676_018056 [Syzygium grande]|nr:hypothetical protein NL676_018056 [Syzygium grande]